MNKYDLSRKLLTELKMSRFLESPFSVLLLSKSLQSKVDKSLRNKFSRSLDTILDSLTHADEFLDPIGAFGKTMPLHFRNYEHYKQLDEIAMGFVLSNEVNAIAFQGSHDEIAIAIDRGMLTIAEHLFNALIHFFLTEPDSSKSRKTKELISNIISKYITEKEILELDQDYSKEVEYVSFSCSWSLVVFCLLHEVGHVLKGHFLDCHNPGNEIQTIRLEYFQEFEADKFAMIEWHKYHEPISGHKGAFLYDDFSERRIGFDPATLKGPLSTFVPISVDIIYTIFQLFDRLVDRKTLSHPPWHARKKHIRKCIDRNLSRRQRGVLATVESLIT